MRVFKIYYLVMIAVLVSITSCKEDDDLYPQLGNDPRNLTEIISETSDLSTLSGLLVQAGLDETLRTTTT